MHCSYKYLVSILIFVVIGCGRERSVTHVSEDVAGMKRDPSTAVIGDSIAVGVFAPTKVGVWPKEIWALVEEVISDFKFDTNREVIAKRINKKAQAVTNEENKEQRYATTDEDWGLASAVARKHQIPVKDVKRFLSAKFGATTRSAPTLLKDLLSQYRQEGKGFRAGYVVVMLGANDFCHSLTPNEYAAKLKTAVLELKETHPNSTVVLVSMPPVLELKEIDCHYEVKAKIKIPVKALGQKTKIDQDFTLPGGMSCEDLRRSFCAPLYEDDANEVVAAFAESSKSVYDDLRKTMDIRYAPLYEAKFGKEHVAFDGFHPNVEGQKLIASYIRDQLKD